MRGWSLVVSSRVVSSLVGGKRGRGIGISELSSDGFNGSEDAKGCREVSLYIRRCFL